MSKTVPYSPWRKVVTYGLAGLVLYGFVLCLLLISGGFSLSYRGLHSLFQEHNVAYLSNLLPVTFLLVGYLHGRQERVRRKQFQETLDDQSASIEKTIHFAREIGKGNLAHRFVSDQAPEELALSLDEMRLSLQRAGELESERKLIMEGVSQVGRVLRKNNHDLDQLCDEVLSFLVRKLDHVVQGAMYVVDEAGEVLEMKAAYAYDHKKHLNGSFRFAQGLVGQAAVERQAILRTEIPANYATISSALIEHKKPSSLLFEPLITNEEVFGVIELASFRPFSPVQQKLMGEVAEIIARTISNVRVNKRTIDLLRVPENE
ncbi:MAG: GAF domain-containing protein [Bacteroidales bacterium]